MMYQNTQQSHGYVQYSQSPRVLYVNSNNVGKNTPTTLYRQADGTISANPPTSLLESAVSSHANIPRIPMRYPTMMQSESTVRLGNQSPPSNHHAALQYVSYGTGNTARRQDVSPKVVQQFTQQQSPPAFYHMLQASNGRVQLPAPTPNAAVAIPKEGEAETTTDNTTPTNVSTSQANQAFATASKSPHQVKETPNPLAHLSYEGVINMYTQVKRNCELMELKRLETQKELEQVQLTADQQAAAYTANLQEKQSELEHLEKEVACYKKACDECKEELAEKECELTRLQLEFSQLPSEAMSMVEIQMHVDAKTAELQAERKTQHEEITRLKRDLSNNSKMLQGKEKEISSMKQQIAEAEENVQCANEQVSKIKDQEEHFKKQCKMQQKEMQKIRSQAEDAKLELEVAQQKFSTTQHENEVKEKELQQLKDKIKHLKSAQIKTDNKNTEIANKLQDLQQIESSKSLELQELKKHVLKLNTDLKEKENIVKKLTNQEAKQNEEVLSEVHHMKQDVARLRDCLEKKQSDFDIERKEYESTISRISSNIATLEHEMEEKNSEIARLKGEKLDIQAMLSEKIEKLPNNVKLGEYTMGSVKEMMAEISGLQCQVTDLTKLCEIQQNQIQNLNQSSLEQSFTISTVNQQSTNTVQRTVNCSQSYAGLPPVPLFQQSGIHKNNHQRSAAEFYTPVNKSPVSKTRGFDTSLSAVEEGPRVVVDGASEGFAQKRLRFLNL